MVGMARSHSFAPETVVVAAGRPPRTPDSPLNVPLTPASTYVAGGELEYGRFGNPTWAAFEDAVGALEGEARQLGEELRGEAGVDQEPQPGGRVFDNKQLGELVSDPLGAHDLETAGEFGGRLHQRPVGVPDAAQVHGVPRVGAAASSG